MLQQMYRTLTAHEGMYLCYVVPLGYFVSIIAASAFNDFKVRGQARLGSMAAVVAILGITADFINYLYLFFSKTGKLLPPQVFYAKYALGFVLWGWAIWYAYAAYFSKQAAGARFNKRLLILAVVLLCGLIVGGLGIALFPAHPTPGA